MSRCLWTWKRYRKLQIDVYKNRVQPDIVWEIQIDETHYFSRATLERTKRTIFQELIFLDITKNLQELAVTDIDIGIEGIKIDIGIEGMKEMSGYNITHVCEYVWFKQKMKQQSLQIPIFEQWSKLLIAKSLMDKYVKMVFRL